MRILDQQSLDTATTYAEHCHALAKQHWLDDMAESSSDTNPPMARRSNEMAHALSAPLSASPLLLPAKVRQIPPDASRLNSWSPRNDGQ
jgi:hypothetical protein